MNSVGIHWDVTSEPNGAARTAPDAPQPSRRRGFVFRCAVLLASFVVAVGLCEALLWLFAPIPYHEWLVWEPEGHIRARPMPGQSVHNAAGHVVRINRYGFRGPDYAYEKKPGTLRLAVFGGSAGFCFEAGGREKSWPAALERKLIERLNMPVQVINLSLPGFDVFNSKLNYLCFGRAFHPDAVIVYHTWNDMKMFRDVPYRPYSPAGSVPNKPLWQRVARATQIGRRARNFLWTAAKVRMENTYRVAEGTGTSMDRPVSERAFAWERQNFVDFVTFAKLDGRLPVLVSQAGLGKLGNLKYPDIRFVLANVPEMVGMTVPVAISSWMRVSAIIEEVAVETGAVFVDGYNAVPSDLEHLHDVVHLRDAGSEVLAETIATALLNDERFRALVRRVRTEAETQTE